MFKLRDRETAEKILEKISGTDIHLTLMHVCGTHQDTLVRFGLQKRLEEANVDIRQGPGCPVCVTIPQEIDEIMALARAGKIITAFGDALKVPGTQGSLFSAKSEGADVRIVYGIDDAVGIARKEKDREVVFFAIGFETTAPTTAAALISEPPDNFRVLSTHRIMPPALRAIAEMGEIKLDGLIQPGHVSTIIGTRPYTFLSRDFGIPQVVAGFEPLDLLMAVFMIARQVKSGKAEVQNEYSRVVREEGNPKALAVLDRAFERADVAWRGFPVIPGSRLDLRSEFDKWDARKTYSDIIAEVDYSADVEEKGCICGRLLRGLGAPEDCPLFGRKCTPDKPVGPCMVSREGSCNISFKYGKLKNL
ncbi:MAG TPA: hydrogenase formation protein HypD [Euryarchaeota archaeon]|nr:hydrogenase formation protein HypD [Euryarchaeota archaeon]